MIRRIIRKLADAADRALFPIPDMPTFDCGFSELVCGTCGMDPITCTHSGPVGSQTTSPQVDGVDLPGDDSGAGEDCIHANCTEPGVIPVNYRREDSWLYCPNHFATYGDITDLLLAAAAEIEWLEMLRAHPGAWGDESDVPALHRKRLAQALRNLV